MGKIGEDCLIDIPPFPVLQESVRNNRHVCVGQFWGQAA